MNVREFEAGVVGTAQANGIAGLQSNTVLVGWPKKPGRLETWLRITRALSRVNKSTLITRLNWVQEPGQRQKIVVWWGGLENNGDLMLLLAHLLKLNAEWSEAQIVVRSIADTIHERSTGASIVFLGMHDPEPGGEADYARRLEELASGLCTTVFVRNAGKFAGKLV